jgi:hypothetical protein
MKSHHVLSLSHIIQYILLIFILLTGIFVYLNVQNYQIKVVTAVLLALVYPVWGVWHHWEHHQHFSWRILIEYLLVSTLIIVVLLSIL